jgi:hypothetical protein
VSSDDNRRKARTQRRFAEEVTAAKELSRYLERELSTVRAELEGLKNLFRLYGATPRPGQPLDSWIEEAQRKLKYFLVKEQMTCRNRYRCIRRSG